jgi:hypothetical protein
MWFILKACLDTLAALEEAGEELATTCSGDAEPRLRFNAAR